MDKPFTFQSFTDMLSREEPVIPENMKAIFAFAEQLAREDGIEREAKINQVQSITLGPNLDIPGEWLVSVTYSKSPPKNQNDMMMILGGMSNGPPRKQAMFTSFEQADAFLEKNNYFGCKNTKWFLGVYASWDR